MILYVKFLLSLADYKLRDAIQIEKVFFKNP